LTSQPEKTNLQLLGARRQRISTAFATRPFVDKKSNSTGLQLADLAARPLGLSYMRPEQENRAAKVLQQKMIFPHPKCFP
jgi:hypothetical protein